MFLVHRSAVEVGGAPPPAAPSYESHSDTASPADGNSGVPEAPSPQSPQSYSNSDNAGSRQSSEPHHAEAQGVSDAQIVSEVSLLGRSLGYEDSQVHAALSADPVGTLTVLGQELGFDSQDVQDCLRTNPIQTLIVLRQLAQHAQVERRFDGERDRQLRTGFPNGLADSNRDAVSRLAWSLLEKNPAGYQSLRDQGDLGAIVAAFEEARTVYEKAVGEYGEFEKGHTGSPGRENKAQTMDEIIQNLGNPNVPMDKVFLDRVQPPAEDRGNEGSVKWPPKSDPFWQRPTEWQIEWALDQKAENDFDRRFDAYLKQAYGERAALLPESVDTAIRGMSWQKLLDSPQDYQKLREGNAGNAQAADRHIAEAHRDFKSLIQAQREHKPEKPLDNMLKPLSNFNIADDDALEQIPRPAESRRAAGTRHDDKRSLDQYIADLGNHRLGDEEAIYGRRRA